MKNEVKTWKDMKIKYPEDRDKMSLEKEREFVEDCFKLYEQEGFSSAFSEVFWSPYDDQKQYIGEKFTVLGRVKEYSEETKEGNDLECLPMWKIQFENGDIIDAYPEEIIPSEMKANGYDK